VFVKVTGVSLHQSPLLIRHVLLGNVRRGGISLKKLCYSDMARRILAAATDGHRCFLRDTR
jgi:hypothetical protein